MGNRLIKWTLLGAFLLFIAWLFYQKVYIPKSTYSYIEVKKGDMQVNVFGIGTVSAKDLYPLCSNTGGKLLEVLKDEGEWVKKGELVAKLDPIDLHEQLKALKASLQKAKLEIEALQKSLKALKAQKDLALITFKRYEKLNIQGYAAKAEYDKAKTDLQTITAQIESLKAQIKAAKAEATKAKHTIFALQERLTRLSVYAPLMDMSFPKMLKLFKALHHNSPLSRLFSQRMFGCVSILMSERQVLLSFIKKQKLGFALNLKSFLMVMSHELSQKVIQ